MHRRASRTLGCSSVVFIFIAIVAASFVPVSSRTVRAAQEPVTFNKDVAPIIYSSCVSCHRPGGSAPFGLMTYAEVRQRSALIAAATESHFMPPWQPDLEFGEFEGDRRLPHQKIDIFQRWVEDGSIEGDPRDRPAMPRFPSDWQLGSPDLVVSMSEPFEVPADGPDVFRNFVLRVPVSERRYVEAIEFRPGSGAKVVHHVRILLDETNEVRRLDAADPAPGFGGMDVPGARFPEGHFLGWASGKMPSREAYPWAFEPGSDIVLQMHLKPTGRKETVRSQIGLYFTDTPPVRSPILLRLGSKTMDIPAGESAYEVTDSYRLPVAATALSIYPHAHYLAKEMTVTAQRPDTKVELLHIPDWDFNWQDEYEYAKPINLPAGTTITMKYVYDNSASNPHNPSTPPERVRFGQETTDEMGDLLLQVLPKDDEGAATLRAEMLHKTLITDAAGEEKILAEAPGNIDARNALAVGYVQLGRVPEALDEFAKVLDASPDHPKANYNLGLLAMSSGKFDEAYEFFSRALKAQPDYAEAQNNVGVIAESEGLPDEAVYHYQLALAAKPNNAAAHSNLGRILMKQGKTKDAIAHYRDAARARPDDPDLQYNLARALASTGQGREAIQHLRRGIERRPDSVPMLVDLAQLLVNDGNTKEALTVADRATRVSDGRNPAALDALAAAQAAAGETEQAIRTAETALKLAVEARNDALAVEIRERIEQYQAARGSSPRFR